MTDTPDSTTRDGAARPWRCALFGHAVDIAVIVKGEAVYPHDIPNVPVRLWCCSRCGGAFQ